MEHYNRADRRPYWNEHLERWCLRLDDGRELVGQVSSAPKKKSRLLVEFPGANTAKKRKYYRCEFCLELGKTEWILYSNYAYQHIPRHHPEQCLQCTNCEHMVFIEAFPQHTKICTRRYAVKTLQKRMPPTQQPPKQPAPVNPTRRSTRRTNNNAVNEANQIESEFQSPTWSYTDNEQVSMTPATEIPITPVAISQPVAFHRTLNSTESLDSLTLPSAVVTLVNNESIAPIYDLDAWSKNDTLCGRPDYYDNREDTFDFSIPYRNMNNSAFQLDLDSAKNWKAASKRHESFLEDLKLSLQDSVSDIFSLSPMKINSNEGSLLNETGMNQLESPVEDINSRRVLCSQDDRAIKRSRIDESENFIGNTENGWLSAALAISAGCHLPVGGDTAYWHPCGNDLKNDAFEAGCCIGMDSRGYVTMDTASPGQKIGLIPSIDRVAEQRLWFCCTKNGLKNKQCVEDIHDHVLVCLYGRQVAKTDSCVSAGDLLVPSGKSDGLWIVGNSTIWCDYSVRVVSDNNTNGLVEVEVVTGHPATEKAMKRMWNKFSLKSNESDMIRDFLPIFIGIKKKEHCDEVQVSNICNEIIKNNMKDTILIELVGLPGIGKSSIANNICYQLQKDTKYKSFFWIDCNNFNKKKLCMINDLKKKLKDVAISLHMSKTSTNSVSDVLSRLSHLNAPWLIVLDGWNSFEDIFDCFPSKGGCIIMTNRVASSIDGDSKRKIIHINTIPIQSGINLILGKRQLTKLTQDEVLEARDLLYRMGNLPGPIKYEVEKDTAQIACYQKTMKDHLDSLKNIDLIGYNCLLSLSFLSQAVYWDDLDDYLMAMSDLHHSGNVPQKKTIGQSLVSFKRKKVVLSLTITFLFCFFVTLLVFSLFKIGNQSHSRFYCTVCGCGLILFLFLCLIALWLWNRGQLHAIAFLVGDFKFPRKFEEIRGVFNLDRSPTLLSLLSPDNASCLKCSKRISHPSFCCLLCGFSRFLCFSCYINNQSRFSTKKSSTPHDKCPGSSWWIIYRKAKSAVLADAKRIRRMLIRYSFIVETDKGEVKINEYIRRLCFERSEKDDMMMVVSALTIKHVMEVRGNAARNENKSYQHSSRILNQVHHLCKSLRSRNLISPETVMTWPTISNMPRRTKSYKVEVAEEVGRRGSNYV
eukprot:GHVL01010656.1.p1 GENE.GHVL01010656.1~~GHVL01010656.1.p1  ORF type:complete len:1146 (+),score=219.38 GHVL01010656.1:106-3543(+)